MEEKIIFPSAEVKVYAGPHVWRALRLLGFKRDFDDRSGGSRCVQYSKSIDGRRTVKVQIWGSEYRASSEFRGCSDTVPTYFTTLSEMERAINYESVCMDSQWAVPGSLYSERKSSK